MHQRLRIVRHGQRQEWSKSEPLRHGAAGNEQTLQIAAAWVREDSANDDRIRDLATDLVSRCVSRDAQCEITQLFEFARDEIRFVEDPNDTERIADAWRTFEKKAGDCVDKCILLATLLGSIGYQSEFYVQDFVGDLRDGFDHVRLRVFVNGWPVDLDPTPERALVGWSAPAIYEATFPIWLAGSAGIMPASSGMAGFDFGPLINTGIQFGSNYAQGRLQQSRATGQQNAAIEGEWNRYIAEAVAELQSVSAKPSVTADDVNYIAAIIAALEQWLAQNGTERIRQQWNDPSYKPAFTHSLNVLRSRATAQMQTAGGGPQAAGTLSVPGALATGQASWIDSPYVPVALLVVAGVALLSSRE